MSRGVFVEDNFKNVMTIGGGNLVCCKKMHKVAVRLEAMLANSRLQVFHITHDWEEEQAVVRMLIFNIFFPMIMMVVWITLTVDMVDDE